MDSEGQETLQKRSDVGKERVERLEREVIVWSPACSIFWALWGIVQASEQVEKILEGREGEAVEFDYLVCSPFLRPLVLFCLSPASWRLKYTISDLQRTQR